MIWKKTKKTNWLFPLMFHKSGADAQNDASNALNEYWNMIFIFFYLLFNETKKKTKINSTTWYLISMRNYYSLNRSPTIESVITYVNVNCKLTKLRSAIILFYFFSVSNDWLIAANENLNHQYQKYVVF